MSSSDSLRVIQIASDSTLDASIIAKGMLGIILDTMFIIDPEQFTLPSERRGVEEDDQFVLTPTEATYIKAYPNPFSNTVTLEYDVQDKCMDGCEIRTYDIQGRVVFSHRLQAQDNGRFELDMGQFGNGLYYLTLNEWEGGILQTLKLVKTR